MSAAAIDYIWKAIQESERSDALQFRDDEMLITAAAQGSAQHRTVPPNAEGRKSIAEAAINPKPADSDLPQAVTPPPLPRP